MTMFHKRVVVLNFTDKDMETFAQLDKDEFHRALGRMVAFDLAYGEQDTVSIATGGLSTNPPEICLTYRHTPAIVERYEDGSARYIGSPEQVVNDAVSALTKTCGDGYTIGAVLHSHDNKWGYHS